MKNFLDKIGTARPTKGKKSRDHHQGGQQQQLDLGKDDNNEDTSNAEDHVVASLEQQVERKQQMRAMPKDTKEERIAHLPLLLKKMKSQSQSQSTFDLNASESGGNKSNSLQQGTDAFPNRTKKDVTKTGNNKTDKDAFFENAEQLQTLMEEDEQDDEEDTSTVASTEVSDDEDEDEEGRDDEQTKLLQKTRRRRRHARRKKRRSCWSRFKTRARRILMILRPDEIKENLKQFIQRDVTLFMVPLLAVAFVMYYILGNPDLVFLPNTAHLAWYLLFAVRLQVTFALAQVTQFVLQVVAIRTSLLAQWSGPFVALMAMQAVGWPFLTMAWGLWNILILHGNHPFSKHWLFWTHLAIFSPEHNPDGDGILESDLYGRLLSALVCVGAVSALKRTSVALYLSRRMLHNYKQQLNQTMEEVALITGLAGLAAEVDKPGFEDMVQEAHQNQQDQDGTEEESTPDAAATQIQMEGKLKYMDSVPTLHKKDKEEDGKQQQLDVTAQNLQGPDNEDDQEQWQVLKEQAMRQDSAQAAKNAAEVRQQHGSEASARQFDQVMATLDRWEAPSEPNERESASLQEILSFKKAFARMSDDYPFSAAFGPANMRQTCIKSAIGVYKKLLRFHTSQDDDNDNDEALNFAVIGALAYKEDGDLDAQRAQGLLRLFLPDHDNKVPLHAFVQSCDAVYKRMLFLRASLNNSSKIDSVLEDCFNVIFYGAMGVVVLSMVGYNPWPLLVSFSTIMVSFTFAVGPSAAKLIEGILAIAVRRPFDLGDRILLCEPTKESNLSDTYIVEDINLMTTTLRFAPTNELSTINNASLTSTRVVNCQRSPKACIRIVVKFNVNATLDQFQDFKQRLEEWLGQDPRSWASGSLLQFTPDTVERSTGCITYKIGALHVKPWQDLSAVVKSKGELEVEVDRLAFDLGVQYSSTPTKHRVFLQDEKKNQ